MKILTIIPAKLDSTRLERKNLQKINNKTLVEYSIDYANKSQYEVDIIVSSENDEVKEVALKNGVIFHNRNKNLCGDVEVVDVYLHIINNIREQYDLVVCLQPDNPNRSYTFDECIQYMIDNNYDDLITVNPSYKRSGSVRIFKYKYLKSGQVSKRLGCIKDEAVDIHYQEDLEKIKNLKIK
jgi:CMP-N,N'-diacetyllegionaminic acid synthase